MHIILYNTVNKIRNKTTETWHEHNHIIVWNVSGMIEITESFTVFTSHHIKLLYA